MAARVRPGVFFDQRAPLPRGRHDLSREQVQSAHRERLMASFTELLAERGYASVRVGDIASRAGTSNDAFYEVFASKEECAYTAYDRFIEVLVGRVVGGLQSSEGWQDFIHSALKGYLGTLASDLASARAFTLEMDALGAEARSRRHEALMGFAVAIRQANEQFCKTDRALRLHSVTVHLGNVYAVRQLASDLLDTSSRPDLESLIPDLLDWFVTGFYGPAQVPQSPSRRGSRVASVDDPSVDC